VSLPKEARMHKEPQSRAMFAIVIVAMLLFVAAALT
jgi:hypothetical protein